MCWWSGCDRVASIRGDGVRSRPNRRQGFGPIKGTSSFCLLLQACPWWRRRPFTRFVGCVSRMQVTWRWSRKTTDGRNGWFHTSSVRSMASQRSAIASTTPPQESALKSRPPSASCLQREGSSCCIARLHDPPSFGVDAHSELSLELE